MRFILLTFLISFFALSAQASELMPIKTHLKDATKLNRERRELYAAITNNQSTSLVNELILMERLALLATYHLDKKANHYIKKGVMIFHDDLTDMSFTPPFSPRFSEGNVPARFVKIHIRDLKKRWLKDIRQDSVQSVYEEALYLLVNGDLKETNQNCLTRHFVESIARSLFLLETHRQDALEKGLKDPKELIVSFVKLQIRSLSWAQSLDRRAYKIQKNGVPLFCQDVPPVIYQ